MKYLVVTWRVFVGSAREAGPMRNLFTPLPERHDALRSCMRRRPLIFALVLAGLLDACGGGGSGGGSGDSGGSAVHSSPPPQNPPAQNPPPQNLESAPAPPEPFNIPPVTLTASSGSNSFTATYSETPNSGTTMFDGQAANSSKISLTITENGSPIISEVDTAYYLENPYQPLGLTLSSKGEQQFDFLYNNTNPLPSTLAVGGSGTLGSGTYYVVNTKDDVGSLTETYSVASDGPSYVQLTTYTTGTVNGQPINETLIYGVSASGAVYLDSIEILVNGATLNFCGPGCPSWWEY